MKLFKILKYGFLLLFVAVLIFNIFMKFELGSSRVINLPILSAQSEKINDILVIPLYGEKYGIAVGAIEKTPLRGQTEPNYLISGLFTIDSGEDFFEKEVKKSKGFFWPPMPFYMFVGKSNSMQSCILVKKGFKTKLLNPNDFNMDIKVIMTASDTLADNKKVLDGLLDYKNNQAYLKKLFDAEDLVKEPITTDFDEKDLALLKKYLN